MTALGQHGEAAAPDPVPSPAADHEPALSAEPVVLPGPGAAGPRAAVRRMPVANGRNVTGGAGALRDALADTAEPSPVPSDSTHPSATRRTPFQCPTCAARLGSRHSPREGLARCTILLTATRGLFAYECSGCRSRWSEARAVEDDAAQAAGGQLDTA